MKVEWFSEWFNTPYYHTLYKDRDEKEAELFIDHLIQFLNPDSKSHFLDLACGKGRHAKYLNSLGYRVDGCDLAPASIEEAQKKSNSKLNFFVQDMREPTPSQYNFIFNLFTSIGYFENYNDNSRTFEAVANSLNHKGLFVIDFLNAHKVRSEMIPFEEKIIEGISFKISKKIENKNIVKSIDFETNDEQHHYEEKVTLLEKSDFVQFADACGLSLIHEFGDYQLQPFETNSDRLILIFQKS